MHLYYWPAPTRVQLHFSRQLFFFSNKDKGDVFVHLQLTNGAESELGVKALKKVKVTYAPIGWIQRALQKCRSTNKIYKTR